LELRKFSEEFGDGGELCLSGCLHCRSAVFAHHVDMLIARHHQSFQGAHLSGSDQMQYKLVDVLHAVLYHVVGTVLQRVQKNSITKGTVPVVTEGDQQWLTGRKSIEYDSRTSFFRPI